MHLARLRLRHFRNYERLDVPFDPGVQVLLGRNAQGKTNILEAVYLLATLRSFRGATGHQMTRHQQESYFVGAAFAGTGDCRVKMFWSPHERRITLNGEPVRKMADYFGMIRVVVFCTEDLQLVKGTGRIRRRFLDLLLAQTHPGYLQTLQRYTRTLRSRNTILKSRSPDAHLLEAFTRELISLGNRLMEERQRLIPRFSPLARLAYRKISEDAEELQLNYAPSIREDFESELHRVRNRELAQGITLVGPHRDELKLILDGKSAANYASEGQKRSLAIALKIAQAEYLSGIHGAPPILLIDDVMGELDDRRRQGFLPLLTDCLRKKSQVFMTCTEENWPRNLAESWHRWQVTGGQLVRMG